MADKIPTSVAEFELLKKTFKGNRDVLINIRTLLLGFEISESYKQIIKTTFSNPEVFRAFRKKIFAIYGEDTPDAPLESISDIWSNSNSTILGGSQSAIKQELEMRQLTVDMLIKGIKLLQNPDGEKVNTDYNPARENDEWGIKLLARNYYVGSIQQGISNLSIMVEADMPNQAQIKNKQKKDSTE